MARMKDLKALFTIKENKEKLPQPEENNEDLGNLTYKQSGYSDSRQASGNHVNLRAELQRIYQNFKLKCREDENLQEKLRQPHIEELERCRTEKKNFETLLSIKEKDKEKKEGEINSLKEKIERIKQDPKKEGIPADRKPEVQFWIGLFLLIPITLYLVVFYISASYSAFFKEFGADANVMDAIFDAQALSKALGDGLMEFLFVLTIPFAFMGLGYLIHMFQKSNGKQRILKIAGLVAVTFIFDAILAYQIDKGVFDVNKSLGEKFDLSIAVTSASFWAIIFAGFVVYMIWGLVLDFVLKEHENKDKVKLAIKGVEKTITIKNDQLSVINNEIKECHNKIKDCENAIIREQSSIDGFLIPVREYLAYHTEYVSGWLKYISNELPLGSEEKQHLLNKCKRVSDNFLEEEEELSQDLDIEEESPLSVA
jgi:hypothetical protein